jgi:hypothetical protein
LDLRAWCFVQILQSLNYPPPWIELIALLIGRHDSREQAGSLEEEILKDADKLWRFSRVGFWNEMIRQGLDGDELYRFLSARVRHWFFTPAVVKLAEAELNDRGQEIAGAVPPDH